jgi:hypothetical protein
MKALVQTIGLAVATLIVRSVLASASDASADVSFVVGISYWTVLAILPVLVTFCAERDLKWRSLTINVEDISSVREMEP